MDKKEQQEILKEIFYFLDDEKVITFINFVADKVEQKAKKEVFDDIEELFGLNKKEATIKYFELKQRHLSTFQKKSDIIADKQNPQINDKLCKVCLKKLTEHSRVYDNHIYEPAD